MAKDLLSSFSPAAETWPSRQLILQIGTTFGPFYINFFASRPTFVGIYSANPISDTLTLANHGLSNGAMVQFSQVSSSVLLTDGLDTGDLYFVVSATTNTFQLSLIPGGLTSSFSSVVDIKSNDPGKLYRCGTPYNLTNHRAWAWVKHLATDADTNLVLDLQPTIVGADLGFGYDWRVTFTKTDTQTFNLSASTNVWDLIMQFPDGTRSLLMRNNFLIQQPATHPNLIS